eukprot:CAMPEP_0185921430 /NCGR_PEP_ID=MMETSP0924C-20121207/8963_1 /TAXON_ID=321610 /ORGANISM="Perkinsus chesapeaki, Strain ATCC PRA-65" /LENGTH=45 /DNA_ID= /DNA_START= /DNA_END= /DNA_ORIENTATION=
MPIASPKLTWQRCRVKLQRDHEKRASSAACGARVWYKDGRRKSWK